MSSVKYSSRAFPTDFLHLVLPGKRACARTVSSAAASSRKTFPLKPNHKLAQAYSIASAYSGRRAILGVPSFLVLQRLHSPSAAFASGMDQAVVIKTCGVNDRKSQLAELLKGPQPYLVMYSSDYDLQTGETWCPDCRRAVPGVLSALKENGVGSLLLVQVGSRAEWKSPDHPFKTDPSLKISGVPTLVRLRPGGSEAARLGPELESSATAEEAKQLAASFITKAD